MIQKGPPRCSLLRIQGTVFKLVNVCWWPDWVILESFVTNVAKHFVTFGGIFEKCPLLSEKCCGYFLELLGHFYSYIRFIEKRKAKKLHLINMASKSRQNDHSANHYLSGTATFLHLCSAAQQTREIQSAMVKKQLFMTHDSLYAQLISVALL